MSLRFNIFLALSCSLILANLYYAQPVLADIGASIGLHASSFGLIMTMAQLGYCIGVLLIAPLGDMLESKRVILCLMVGVVLSLLVLGFCHEKTSFLIAIFCLGLSNSVIQLIVPYGAALAHEHERGRAVGILLAGALFGIALARPVGSLITSILTWRACFLISSALMLGITVMFARYLPQKPPETKAHYGATLVSMARMLFTMPALQVRAILMSLVFFVFTLFWATVPIVLQSELAFSHVDIALFSLASLVAPIFAIVAGQLADRGLGFRGIYIGLILISMALLLVPVFGFYAALFLLSAFMLDSGVNMSNATTQQSVIALDPQSRSRLNSLLIFVTFIGGATGSSLGPWLYSHYGWTITAMVGLVAMSLAVCVHIASKYVKSNVKGSSPMPIDAPV